MLIIASIIRHLRVCSVSRTRLSCASRDERDIANKICMISLNIPECSFSRLSNSGGGSNSSNLVLETECTAALPLTTRWSTLSNSVVVGQTLAWRLGMQISQLSVSRKEPQVELTEGCNMRATTVNMALIAQKAAKASEHTMPVDSIGGFSVAGSKRATVCCRVYNDSISVQATLTLMLFSLGIINVKANRTVSNKS